MEPYLTIKDVMEKYNKTYTQVWYAIRTNKLIHHRIGWQYIIPVKYLPQKWPK